MEVRKHYLGGEPVETVYFGGGTPSLLEAQELDLILQRLRATFRIDAEAEITLEANPDDITASRLQAWREAGVNRLSIGVQSFFEEDLRWMNRAHDARQAIDCIRMAQSAGFYNMSIDLIYGGPTLSDQHWKENVERAMAMGIPHLSCYALTVEPRTALETQIRRGRVADVSPEDQARQFLLLMDWAAAAGYEHYEISNFALPGYRSRHNSSYWQGKSYLGLGASAHSFNGVSREWNVANNARYIEALMGGPSGGVAGGGLAGSDGDVAGGGAAGGGGHTEAPGYVAEREVLTPVQQLNEYIMISLRTMEGIDLSVLASRAAEVRERGEKYIQAGKLQLAGQRLQLTRDGKLLADGIAADLFF